MAGDLFINFQGTSTRNYATVFFLSLKPAHPIFHIRITPKKVIKYIHIFYHKDYDQ